MIRRASPLAHRTAALAALAALLLLGLPPAGSARELATDRPDVTESPVPVEAGRWQLELDAFAIERGEGGARSAQFAVLNLKRGLDASTDLQLLLAPVTLDRAPDALGGESELAPVAFGVRLKRALWGADGGETALGLLPWATWQTGTGDASVAWSAGLAVPFSAALGAGFGGGSMLQAASVHDGRRRTTQWSVTASAGRALSGPLGGYLEWVATAAADAIDTPSTLASFGLTYRASEDLQFDAGVRAGLVRHSDDAMFVGVAVRR